MNRIIYYYQTFVGLKDILYKETPVTNIHLSSFHFGTDAQNKPYIHLNDYKPDDPKFDSVWKDITSAKELGIKIIIMLGGAGGAYTTMFQNFELYYGFLKELILKKRDIIDGIDLDIEEYVDIENVYKLINQIKTDFGDDFIITMAPIETSLEYNYSGIGGFRYKDLYNKMGNKIEYFNVQCYMDFSLESIDKMVNNNYPVDKLVMGSISSQDLDSNLNQLKLIKQKYPNFGGAYNWEYSNSPPDISRPGEWARRVKDSIDFL